MRVEKPSNHHGTVESLHLHPSVPGGPMSSVPAIEVVAEKGICGEPRYYGKRNAVGTPSSRQISLIEREQVGEHAAVLGLSNIPAGAVRANIETSGIDLVPLVGRRVRVGTAVLAITKPRDPCEKMDRICEGLRRLMEDNKQGVLARVVADGTIRVGDAITMEAEGAR